MKRTAVLLVVAALAGCATIEPPDHPAPLVRPGKQVVVHSEESPFDAAGTWKPRRFVTVHVEAATDPVFAGVFK